jgi:hypothetical protein
MPSGFVQEWEEAFDKFGFDDGDKGGYTRTCLVAEFIDSLGYESEFSGGLHNTYFDSIKDKSGKDFLDGIEIGYSNPREYLPESLVQKLDEHFKERRDER